MENIVRKSKSKLSNKLKDESFSIDNIANYCLLLNVGETSFELAVVDTSSNKCILLEEYTLSGINSNEDLNSELNNIWENHHILQAGFWKKIRLCFKNQNFTFIPRSLFDKSKTEEYISFSTPFNKEKDVSSVYKHLSTDAINVYSYPKIIKESIVSRYPKIKIEIVHQTSALIEGVIRNSKAVKEKNVFLYVDYNNIILIVTENKKLIFCNRFSFTSTEDFIYYILFIYNELDLNTEDIGINIYGEIAPNSPLYEAINKYIRHSNFGKRPNFLNFSYHFDEVFDHKFFSTYSIYLCE